MNEKDIKEIHARLTNQVKEYIFAILSKYGKYMPDEQRKKLEDITDFSRVVHIESFGSINGYAGPGGVYLPLDAFKVIELIKQIPEYGSDKNHRCYQPDSLIQNDNTFMTYIHHMIVSGATVEDYYQDLLLHEVMHYCGSGGSTALREGLNELLTRKIALEKGFRTNGCAYPKEVAMCLELEKIFGEDVMNQISFIPEEQKVFSYLETMLGEKEANLYRKVSFSMEQSFSNQYYRYMNTFQGIDGVYEKEKRYRNICYDKAYQLIRNYKQDMLDSNQK